MGSATQEEEALVQLVITTQANDHFSGATQPLCFNYSIEIFLSGNNIFYG